MTTFSGKVALVVGVDTPAGAATALRLAADGVRVCVTAVQAADATACADRIHRAGGQAEAMALDVLSEPAWAEAVAMPRRVWGRIDFLVAAIGAEEPPALLQAGASRVAHLLDTLVLGPWLGLKQAIIALRAAGQGGAIVTIAAGGQRPANGLVATAVQGLRLMTRSAARECGAHKDGIRVNLVEAGIGAGTLRPDDIAQAVLHLCAPESAFTSGSALVVGGAAAQPPSPAYTPRDEGGLRGKVALVTGATSGLGRACAIVLAQRGARVIVTGRNEERGAETLAAIRAAGSEGIALRQDVTLEADWRAVLERATQAFGPLDILINNAGDRRPGEIPVMSLENARHILRVNVLSTFLGCALGSAAMAPQGGVILNMSSIGGVHGSVGNVDYSASKAMVTYLSREMAVDLAGRGIRVVAISPGVFLTEGFYRNRPTAEAAEEDRKKAAAFIPLGRTGEPAELGAVMAFLVSDAARAMTGNNFIVDGGVTA